MGKILQKMKENRKITDRMVIFMVALVLVILIFHPNNDLYFDDGSQHLMRAYYTYKTVVQNGTANIISSFVNGFGYSWDLFYGPLSTDFIIILGIIFGSFNLGFTIGIFLILFFAGSLMYQLVDEIMDDKNMACLAGIIYMTSPYFLTDLYVRHAMRRMYGIYLYSNGIFGIV